MHISHDVSQSVEILETDRPLTSTIFGYYFKLNYFSLKVLDLVLGHYFQEVLGLGLRHFFEVLGLVT